MSQNVVQIKSPLKYFDWIKLLETLIQTFF